MSPDNHYSSPFLKKLSKSSAAFATAFPNIAKHILDDEGSFRGMTMFLGDTADIVVGLRIFSDDGTPSVIWSSGPDAFLALMNLDKAVGTGNFKVDKKAMSSSPPPPPTK